MPDAPEDVEILDRDGGVWLLLPLLMTIEYFFIELAVTRFGHVSGITQYSTGWWIAMVVDMFLLSALGFLIFSGVFEGVKQWGKTRRLVINKNGISYPYDNNLIAWNDLYSSYTKDVYYRGGMRMLYIVLRKRKFGFENLFGSKANIILARKMNDTDDIESSVGIIDYYLAMKERSSSLHSP